VILNRWFSLEICNAQPHQVFEMQDYHTTISEFSCCTGRSGQSLQCIRHPTFTCYKMYLKITSTNVTCKPSIVIVSVP